MSFNNLFFPNHDFKDFYIVLVTVPTLLDTGASINCVTENFVKKQGLTIVPDKESMIELIAAEGNAMKITGTTKLRLQLPGGGLTTNVALV